MASQQIQSSPDDFWSRRYKAEGVLWGEQPSPTAEIAIKHFLPGIQVVEIGFGYGRDLVFLAQQGFKITGVDSSTAGSQMARSSLSKLGVNAEKIFTGRFESVDLPQAHFAGVLSHRFLHLLTNPNEIDAFLDKLLQITLPGAIICIGARDTTDLNTEQMISKGNGVFEYCKRPGHLISYWDQKRFTDVFASSFEILDFTKQTEQESKDSTELCHLTVMVAIRKTI
jgi:SAM-dependent methyltransferase